MKKYRIILSVVLFAALALGSCIQETFPENDTASSGQIGGSESGLQAMVSSLNAQMTTFNTLEFKLNEESHWDFGYPAILMMRELMSNDMATFVSSYHQFRNWETNIAMSGDYAASRFMWTFYYKLVYLSNSILQIKTDGEFAGIAHAYRALAYLDMVRMYDFKANNYTSGKTDVAVPIVTENTTEDDAANNPRAATSAVYDFVEADLVAAERQLANYARAAKNTPDQTVVWGLMARFYLEKGARFNDREAYGKAAQYARKVIDSGKYRPLTASEWTSKTTGFNSSASPSWIWSVNITSADRVVTTGICNFISMISSECSFGYALAGGKDSPQKCVDRKFYESIPATDFRKGSWLAPDYGNASSAIQGEAWARENLNPYVQLKFRPGQGVTSEYQVAAAADVPLMRIEEMYLIEAEATGLAGTGNGQSLLETFVKTYRDASYTYDSSKSLSENVLQQKRIEFWGEGVVFFDYKRLNKGVERGYVGTNHYDATRFNTDGIAPWFNLCINIREMNSNAGITAADNNPDPTGKVSLWEE